MFCSVCGSQNAPQLRFCRACGKPLSSAETLSADADDPLKTRLSIPADQSAFKAAAQPPQPQGADPMATVVGMPAVNPLANANPSAPDPFATQVGGQGLNVNQLKELAAKSATQPPQGADPMATVVGMPAVNPLANANPSAPDPFATQVGGQGLNINQLKELAAKSAANKNNAPASGGEIDSLATVVGMPAITPPVPPKPSPAPVAPAKAPALAEKPKVPDSKLPIPPPQQNLPSNMFEAEAKSGSSTMMIVGIVIAVILIIVAALAFRK